MIVKELDLTGKNLNNYKIMDKLGKGGMATVYKAHEFSLNRVVALKVLSPRLSDDADFIKRFQREAQAAAQLNHPNIVQIYAIGEEKGIHYFAMEYIKGKTLAEISKKEGILSPDKAITIIKQVAEALGEAHKVNLVHRDIKPSNIMIDSSGKAKVTDFGIAFLAEAKTKLTREGSVIGTPEYLSPEQCEGKTVDGRSDIYSLGVTLYEILAGKTPYEADTPVSMLVKIMKGNFSPIGEVNPDVPKPIQELVDKMMETDPQNRYSSVKELQDSLKSLQKEISSPGVMVEEKEAVSQTEPEPVVSTVEHLFQEKKKNSNVWPAVIVAAIIVMLLGGAFAAKVFYFDKKAKGSESSQTEVSTVPLTAQTPTSVESYIPSQEGETTEGTDPTSSTASTPSIASTHGSSQQTVSTAKTSPAQSTTPRRHIVKKPPPANSLIVTTLGDDDKTDLITSYAQSVFSSGDFTIIDGPSVGDKGLGDIAMYHLVITVKNMGSTTLEYYGKTSEQYTVGLTMKAIATQNGKIAAGPVTGVVKYTTLNGEENLKKAVGNLAFRLFRALKDLQ